MNQLVFSVCEAQWGSHRQDLRPAVGNGLTRPEPPMKSGKRPSIHCEIHQTISHLCTLISGVSIAHEQLVALLDASKEDNVTVGAVLAVVAQV